MEELGNTEPTYTAVYRHGVDEKRRVQVPAKWRAPAGQDQEFALVLWPDGFKRDACLMAFPTKVFRQLIDRLASKPFNDPEANALRRFIGERADTATVDKAGRICLPEQMARAVGIDKEAVLVGMLDRYQIWNPKQHEESGGAVEGLAASAWQKV